MLFFSFGSYESSPGSCLWKQAKSQAPRLPWIKTEVQFSIKRSKNFAFGDHFNNSHNLFCWWCIYKCCSKGVINFDHSCDHRQNSFTHDNRFLSLETDRYMYLAIVGWLMLFPASGSLYPWFCLVPVRYFPSPCRLIHFGPRHSKRFDRAE